MCGEIKYHYTKFPKYFKKILVNKTLKNRSGRIYFTDYLKYPRLHEKTLIVAIAKYLRYEMAKIRKHLFSSFRVMRAQTRSKLSF